MNIGINAFKTWADAQINSGAADQAAMLPAQANEAPQQNRPLAQRNMLGLQGSGAALGDFIRANRAGNAVAQGAQSPLVRNELRTGTEEYKQANNQVRSSILSMVRKELGLPRDASIDSFPSGVKKAMKFGFLAKLFDVFNDWSEGNARPLSARRIKAITDAVQAEKEKPVTNLKNLGEDMTAVVDRDPELQKALKGNPKGAEQLCKALKKSNAAKAGFINSEGFRSAILHNLKDGCQYPLPIGKLSFTPTGRSGEFAKIKQDVSTLLNEAFSNTDKEGKYDEMLNVCCQDYGRLGFLVMVNGRKEDLMDGIKRVAGAVSNDEFNRNQMEQNISRLLIKLGLPDTKTMRMQMLEFLTQGSTKYTTLGSGQMSRFSFPKGEVSLGKGKTVTRGEQCTYSFTTKDGLKCDLSTNTHLRGIGVKEDEVPLYYVGEKSTIKTSISVGLRIGEGTEEHPWKLEVESIGAPSKDGTTTFNLELDNSLYVEE